MRIAHLSDLHITDGPRLDDHRATLSAIVTAILAARPHLILLSGDIYGRTVPHRSTPGERAVLFPALVRLAEACPVAVIYGNHDFDPDLDVLSSLGGQWPIRVVKLGETAEMQTEAGPASLYCLPYPTKRWLLAGTEAPRGLAEQQAAVEDRLRQLLTIWGMRIRAARKRAPAQPHIFLGHLQVGGSKTSGGEVLAGQEIELSSAALSDLPIDYGALGHLHLRQEVARRCWYAGSTWRNDFGERDPKGWQLVELGEALGPDGRLPLTVEHRLSPCRDFVTLAYRWAADEEDGAPRWITRPTAAEIAACAGAEVRMRLTVPEQWVAGCPWDAEQQAVRTAGAHRLQVERVVEPRLRVRAPAVAEAPSLDAKLRAYWATLGTPPLDVEQASALDGLEELGRCTDEEIAGAAGPLA
jgi:exonuclease SbcD